MDYTNIGSGTILGLGFLCLFTAFNTCQNFASKVLKDDGFENLGFTTLAVLYCVFAFVSFFAPVIVNKINRINVSLSIGALCYTFWIVCFLLPSYYQQADNKDDLPWILNKNFI